VGETRRHRHSPMTQTYSVAEAAAVLGVSDDNVYARLREEDGKVAGIRAIRLGKSWRIPKAPLDALVAGEGGPRGG